MKGFEVVLDLVKYLEGLEINERFWGCIRSC